MYTTVNFKSKKALKEAVAAHAAGTGPKVTLFAPGLGAPALNGTEYVEGPHYPQPHRWYAAVTVVDGAVVAVQK